MNLFNDFLHASAEIIRINSIQDVALAGKPFGEGAYNALVKTLAIAQGLGYTIYNGNGYYGYAEIGEGELFGILGHLDTVPVGNDWSFDPFSGDIVDGYLRGRGVLDDKAPIMACLFAVAELYQDGRIPSKRIRIIFGCNEESGWQCIDKYLEEQEVPKLAFSPDGDFPVINCERGVAYFTVTCKKPASLVSIIGGEYANMVMDKVTAIFRNAPCLSQDICDKYGITIDNNTLVARGKSAHGSTPHKGDNALWRLLLALGESAEISADIWSNIARIVTNTDGSNYGIQASDELSGALTINVGKIYSDEDSITFTLDIRHPLCITREELYTRLSDTFGDNFTLECGAFHNPLYIAPDHELCTALINAYDQVTGEHSKAYTIGGATYARALPTAVAFGPMFPNQESTIHQKDERAKITDLERMYSIYLHAISNLCFN